MTGKRSGLVTAQLRSANPGSVGAAGHSRCRRGWMHFSSASSNGYLRLPHHLHRLPNIFLAFLVHRNEGCKGLMAMELTTILGAAHFTQVPPPCLLAGNACPISRPSSLALLPPESTFPQGCASTLDAPGKVYLLDVATRLLLGLGRWRVPMTKYR